MTEAQRKAAKRRVLDVLIRRLDMRPASRADELADQLVLAVLGHPDGKVRK